MMKTSFLRPLAISVVGLVLLIPASYFLLTLIVRILFGWSGHYYALAPSFLEASAEVFTYHKSAWIIYGPLLAIILNVLAIVQFQLKRSDEKLQLKILYRKYWLNAAIALQSILLFIVLIIYLVIEHYRY